MKLIEEIVDYCLARGMLDETQLLRLQEMGLGCWGYYDYEDYCDDCEALWEKARVEADERLTEIEKLAQVGEEERVLMERVERHSNARMAARRKAGGGSRPVRKKTTAPELDALLAPLLDAMFADDALSRCVVKLGARAGIKETSNVRDASSSLARLSESELLTALTQALDANGRDRLSLNDVYAAILAWPDLTFLKERGGPAVDACRTLLREDYASGVASRDAWLLGESNAVCDLYWYQRFKLGLIAALRTVYETDKATFKRWSTDGGRLPFPRWDKANKTNTICWRVWEAVDQTPREVSYAEWEATLDRVNVPRTLALRLALTDSLAFDFSHLTVVDGDYEQFKDAANKPTVARPPLFSAVQTLCLENADDEEARRLKGVPNLQTLTFEGYSSNVTDAGLSLLSCCANLQTLTLFNLGGVTDAGLSSLSGCANLQTLTLHRLDNVTDAGLSSLSGCANLQALELYELRGITDAGLSSLLNLPNLRRIKASDCGINGGQRLEITLDAEGNRRFDGEFGSDFVLKAFAAQFEGDSLELGGYAITDVGLSSLSCCANLQTLTLRRLSGITDAGLSSLSGCVNLQTLTLWNLGGVTDAGLSSLLSFPSLRRLKVLGGQMNGGARVSVTVDAEESCRFEGKLRSGTVWQALTPYLARFAGVSLRLNTAITDACLSSLSGCANLRTLELVNVNNVTDAVLSSLAGCANLQTLELSYLNRVTDAGLSSLSGGANLRTLKLSNLSGVTDDVLTKLTALKGLRSLSLNRCGGFTGVGVAALGAASNLCSLKFWKCDGASSADVDALRKSLPNCEIRFAPRD